MSKPHQSDINKFKVYCNRKTTLHRVLLTLLWILASRAALEVLLPSYSQSKQGLIYVLCVDLDMGLWGEEISNREAVD